ncbi:hypothetical protein REPUB_Repub06bG0115300 [Reevesia pubescens]
MGSATRLTVAVRGCGHSLQGQAQAYQGVVINMESLEGPSIYVKTGEVPYVDVSGGELWINILHETLKYGLSPKSWTDYLHLSVGRTLSNAGISGQAFRHGPQINNVCQLEGNLASSPGLEYLLDLQKRWVLYSEFSIFSNDQEHLLSSQNSFDYIEGFVIINRTGLLNNWRSSFNPKDPIQASQFSSDGKILYCLEMAKYFNPDDTDILNQRYLAILLKTNNNGPILIYPVNKAKWNNRTSMVTPEEDIIYLVAFLSSALPSSTGIDGLEHIMTQNQHILDFCAKAQLGANQYLPH